MSKGRGHFFPENQLQQDAAGRVDAVTVEVILHIRITLCPGPLSLGDPIHTTTLLPGEKVKVKARNGEADAVEVEKRSGKVTLSTAAAGKFVVKTS